MSPGSPSREKAGDDVDGCHDQKESMPSIDDREERSDASEKGDRTCPYAVSRRQGSELQEDHQQADRQDEEAEN